MSSKGAKGQEPIPYQALLDENRALKDEMQSFRARLEEAEELRRAISEGDLDALVLPGPDNDLIFTLDSADRAYRVLVETMNEGTATLASDGTILYCNRRFAELLRMHPQAIVGTSIYRFIAPESASNFNALLEHKKDMGEIKLRTEGGASLPVYLSISSMQVSGSPNAWCLVVTDLTEQKKNEEIVAAERLARSIIEQAAEGIVVCNTSGKITHFSNTINKICECDPTFHRFEDLMDLRFSEGVDAGGSILPVSAALNGSTIIGMEAIFERKDFQNFYLLLNSGPLKNDNGEIIGCVVTLTDITERKRAEEALRESEAQLQVVIAHSPDIIFEQDRDLRYNWIFNPASPYAASDVLGKTDAELLPPDQAQQLESIKRRVLDKGIREQAILQLAPGGEPRWYEAIYDPRFDEAGQVIGVLSYTRDITERKRAEEALREAEETARQRLVEIEDLYRNAPVGLCVLDRELRYVRINERLAKINGIPAAAHIGKRVRDLMPQLADAVEPGMFRVLETGQPRLDIEIFSETPARPGVKRSWLEQWLPITDDKGQVMGLSIVVKETTERKRHEAMREAIVSINQIIHSTLDFDEIMKQTVSEAAKVVESDSTAISLRKDGRWIVSYVHGLPDTVIGMEMSDEEEPHAVLAIKTRKPVAISDAFNNERVNRNHMKEWGIRSVLVVPLVTKSRVIGVLFFNYQKATFEFDDIHVDFATQLASSISLALENSYLYENLEIELTEREKADEKLLKAYEQIKIQSEELQVSNEELQTQTEELRVTNEALQESEKRFRTLAENSPDIIARFDRQNRHTYVNPAAAKVYGLSQEEMIGKTYSEMRRDSEQVRLLETYYEIVFATGKPETIDFQYTSPQGKEYYFNTKIVPEFANGKVNSILTISYDITDIKKAETKLKETLDNLDKLVKERTAELEQTYKTLKESERGLAEAQKMAHVGNWDHNLITGEEYWSDETYRILGYNPQEFDATYDAFLNHVYPDDLDYVDNAIKQALNGKPSDINYRIILADGEERTVRAQAEVVFKENIPVCMRGTVQDITERKKAEEVLARIEIARKQEIHHRIKNNLQVISSLLDLQAEQFRDRDNIIDSEVLKAFRESQDRVISMALIHEELYKGGGFETLNFSPYIEELTENLFRTYRLGNADISLKTDLAEHIFFDMDTAVPLGMIINELVSNSLKHAFIGRDKGEILIKLHREKNAECISSIEERGNEDCESTGFTLSVSDNGVGIPENLEIEDLDTLGFQLVTTLVDQLDGELELKKNNGTEFTMRFTVTEKNNQV